MTHAKKFWFNKFVYNFAKTGAVSEINQQQK